MLLYFLENTSYGIMTNSNGDFNIKNVTPGKYTLNISSLGYSPIKNTITVVANKTTAIGVIKLQ